MTENGTIGCRGAGTGGLAAGPGLLDGTLGSLMGENGVIRRRIAGMGRLGADGWVLTGNFLVNVDTDKNPRGRKEESTSVDKL